jgi:peptidoglycan/LPS O-acetylase OafA/YrhL
VTPRTTRPRRNDGTSLGYLPGLDGLRAVSVLAVLAFHHYFIGGHEQGFAPGGFLGVEVFFVVSGYLITALLLAERRRTGGVSLTRFWIRRARRLLPALFLLLAVVILYAVVFLPDSINTLKSNTLAALSYTSNWWLIISHQSYAAEAGRPGLLKHLWSLAIEEQFYLLWPPLLVFGLNKLGRRRMLTTMFGVAIASTVVMAILVSGSINSAYYGTETRLSGLLLGSMMAFFFAPYQIRGKPGRGARVALDLAGVAGLAVLIWSFRTFTFPQLATSDTSVFRGGFLLVDVATLFVIAAVVHPRSDVGPLLGWQPLRWIGLRSYGLYLWHYPIFCITRPELDVPITNTWLLLAFRLGLSFGAAELSFRFVETPIRNGAIGRYWEQLHTERGVNRRRVERRGVFIAGCVAGVVIIVGTTLASAQGEQPKIPGINQRAPVGDKGNKADQAIIDRLRKQSTTTTTTIHRATGPSGSTPTSKPTTPTTVNRLADEVLAIGDSVMLGARQSLESEIPNMYVDAKVSRQFWDATVVLAFYKQNKLLPPRIVVHMGTNGKFSEAQFDDLMRTVGNRQVFFVNAREPRPWETDVNNVLDASVKRYPKNAHLLNWHDFGGSHADWFTADGIHLTDAGAINYATFIHSHLQAGR